jgi:alkyldihydroxyacetonephosphate synthase
MGLSTSTNPSWTDRLRETGWGYTDTKFELNEKGQVSLNGSRYLFSGKALPSLRTWMEDNAGLDIDYATPVQDNLVVPPSVRNEAFLAQVEGHYAHISFTDKERLFHGHGHTTQELFKLRWGQFPRVPDVVIWPNSHEHVETIVHAAIQHDCVIIPYGGGTNVTQALLCPTNEGRMIVSLDMHAMCRIKWVDRTSMLACIEAGAVGKELEEKLGDLGLCLGHEPDSMEFSTLGGWISTRASGMRKNRYGNIEDIVRRIRIVTPSGTMERTCTVPRQSTGVLVYSSSYRPFC